MSLQAIHKSYGATLAPDGIPLHYGDLIREYQAGLHHAILLDRSHEGRVRLYGASRYELLNRMSTNKMIEMNADEGRATIFTNPTARVIDRIEAYNRSDHLLILTEPGRNEWLVQFLQANIFFGDDARVDDITTQTHLLGLHGPHADMVLNELGIQTDSIAPMHAIQAKVEDATFYAMRRKVISGQHWALMTTDEHAPILYQALMQAGNEAQLIPAGGLTYNTLRIRSGRPARPELNTDYIPLELGVWDEVSFAKGCYTGQEIIARMESRSKLAKTIVALDLTEMVNAPAEITRDGAKIGKLTSSVQAPDGTIFAIAIIKTQAITPDTSVLVDDVPASVGQLLGKQPDYINTGE
ncbi:MAG: YgfZ/GcvT domain-containing protein [Anaerolineae bacterium]